MHAFVVYIIAAFVLLTVWEICSIVYRLFFHPLAHIPGPRIASATQWYEFYHDVLKWPGGQYWLEVDKMHERYGEFPRYLTASIYCQYHTNLVLHQADLPVRPIYAPEKAILEGLSRNLMIILSDADVWWHSNRSYRSCHSLRSAYQGPSMVP